MQFQIKHRFTGEVIFTAKIEVSDDTPLSVKLGLAVKGAVQARANLRGADLYGADLYGADLSGTNLSGANLGRADLYGVDLRGANLHGVDLRGVDLRGADLSEANLYGADLRGADLYGANLYGVNLYGVNLSGVDLGRADLSRADLRGADLYGANLRTFRNDLWAVLLTAQEEVPGVISALMDGRVDGSIYTGECACLVGTIANLRNVPVDDLEQDSNRPAEQWFMMIKKGDKPGDETGGGFASRMAVTWALELCELLGIEAPEGATA